MVFRNLLKDYKNKMKISKKMKNSIFLTTFLTIFHVVFIILMGFFASYKYLPVSTEVPAFYASNIL